MQPESFPWRSLGTLLVDEGLPKAVGKVTVTAAPVPLTGLSTQDGKVLLVTAGIDFDIKAAAEKGIVTIKRTGVLAEQHGVEIRTDPDEEEPRVSTTTIAANWTALGKLLVQKGLVKEDDLESALAEQGRHPGSRLGEILVGRGYLSGAALARALAEQHGVALGPEPILDEAETVLRPSVEGEPTYLVCNVVQMQSHQTRSVLYESPNFLEATDFAFEYVEEHEPEALEIQRTGGAEPETVWTYSAARAAALAADRRGLVETFGFDPTSWGRS